MIIRDDDDIKAMLDGYGYNLKQMLFIKYEVKIRYTERNESNGM